MTGEENRRELYELLQQHLTLPASLEGGVLTGFVVIGTIMVPSGDVAIHRQTGSADGRPLLTWEVDGLLHSALWYHRPRLGPLEQQE